MCVLSLGDATSSTLAFIESNKGIVPQFHWSSIFDAAFSNCWASGKLTPTLLACLVPPTVRTKARFMHVHRFVTWADRVLQLSPPGGAPRASM